MKTRAIIESIEEYQRIENAIEKLRDFEKDVGRVWNSYSWPSLQSLVAALAVSDLNGNLRDMIISRIRKLEAVRDGLEVD